MSDQAMSDQEQHQADDLPREYPIEGADFRAIYQAITGSMRFGHLMRQRIERGEPIQAGTVDKLMEGLAKARAELEAVAVRTGLREELRRLGYPMD